MNPRIQELLRELAANETALPGHEVPVEIEDLLRLGQVSERDGRDLTRYYNIRRAFLEDGAGVPFADGHADRRLTVDMNPQLYREVIGRIPEQMLHLGASLAGFIAILDTGAEASDPRVREFIAAHARLARHFLHDGDELARYMEKSDNPGAETIAVSRKALFQYLEMTVAMLDTSLDILDFCFAQPYEGVDEDDQAYLDGILEGVEKDLERTGLKGFPADAPLTVPQEEASGCTHQLVFNVPSRYKS